MDISTRQSGIATIVDIVGDITLYNSPQVRKVLLDLLKDKKSPRVIVNLEKVRYIDSAGVASLVEGLKVSRDMKSTFAMFGLSRTAREVLELTRLIKGFEVYDNEADALRGGSTNVAQAGESPGRAHAGIVNPPPRRTLGCLFPIQWAPPLSMAWHTLAGSHA